MEKWLCNIQNIEVYDRVHKLFKDYGYPLDHPSEDMVDYLNSIDDYEPIINVVINGEYVFTCDSLNGDCINPPVTIEQFKEYSLAAYYEAGGAIDE